LKILVTGAAGFIGSHVADAYVAGGHDVVVLDNQASRKKQNVNPKARVVEMDVTSPGIDGLFGSERFEMVNHHAAQVSVSASVADPQFDARVNIMGALNLLGASAKHGVRKFIFASSGGTVYGATDKLPATEDLPFAAASPYGVSKVATELYLRIFAEQRGLRYTALRYSNVYGPRQDPHGEAGVVAIFTEKMFTGGRPVICGDGEYFRDYVYVADVARANVLALGSCDNDAVNIGTGRRTSTNQLFSMLKKLTGYPGPEEHGSARAGDLRDSCLAVAKAARVLGWEPRVQMEEGLRQTVDWFRSKPGAI
jgi:UDP-glucose 4-epimerase